MCIHHYSQKGTLVIHFTKFDNILTKNILYNAFDNTKAYLTTPPVLASPVKGKSLVLYITIFGYSFGALSAQENDEGKENALY